MPRSLLYDGPSVHEIKLLKYLSAALKLLSSPAAHARLSKALRPFGSYPLIRSRTSYIYLFDYLSKCFDTRTKYDALHHHYGFIREQISPAAITDIFSAGLRCWDIAAGGDMVTTKLHFAGYFEFEGSFMLVMQLNNIPVYSLSFSIVPAGLYRLSGDSVIVLSCLQGRPSRRNEVRVITKYFDDIVPPTLLLETLSGIGSAFGITQIVCVSLKNQLSYHNDSIDYYADYDKYWSSQLGGLTAYGDYLLPVPVQLKPLSDIPVKYRGRTARKRETRRDIFNRVYILVVLTHHSWMLTHRWFAIVVRA